MPIGSAIGRLIRPACTARRLTVDVLFVTVMIPGSACAQPVLDDADLGLAVVEPAVLATDLSPTQKVIGWPGISSGPAAVRPACPTFAPWRMLSGIARADMDAAMEGLRGERLRPVSISAVSPDGDNALFDVVAIQDEFAVPDRWDWDIDLDGDEVRQMILADPARRPVAIDGYARGGERAYALLRVQDGFRGRIATEVLFADLQATDEANGLVGFSPIWVDGLRVANATRFSAIWVNDGIRRELDDEALVPGQAEKAWRAQTGADMRMLRMTEFPAFVPGGNGETELRRLAVWQAVDEATCGSSEWAATPDESRAKFDLRVVSADRSPAEHEIEGGAVTIDIDEIPGLVHVGGTAPDVELGLRQIDVAGGTPAHGDVLILAPRMRTGPVRVWEAHYPTYDPPEPSPPGFEVPSGNIRLRRWNDGGGPSDAAVDNDPACVENALLQGCTGQAMPLDSFDTRLALAWNDAEQVFEEVARGDLLPDHYGALATDTRMEGDEPRISATWIGRTDRVPIVRAARPVGAPSQQDIIADRTLRVFDRMIMGHMQDRLIPGAVFAVAIDGRVVAARGYGFLPEDPSHPEVPEPFSPFRVASLSKAVTAMAVLRLADQGLLDLDAELFGLPGFVDATGWFWSDPRALSVTTRHLLQHLGGWDRDLNQEPVLGRDFEICAASPGTTLPLGMPDILDFGREQDLTHGPGTYFSYSNWGYSLLGRVIEAVTGQSYEDYVRETFLPEALADHFTLIRSGRSLVEDPLREVRGHDVDTPQASSVLGIPPLGSHPLRDGCRPGHADLVPLFLAGPTGRMMDSHGGWIVDAPSLARLLSLAPQFLEEETFAEMTNRPAGRATRFVLVDGASATTDVSWDLRPNSTAPPGGQVLPAAGRLEIGIGLRRPGTLRIALDAPGGDGTARLRYVADGGALRDLAVEDGTLGLTQDGAITFDVPDDWIATIRNDDVARRYWLVLDRVDAVGPPPEIELIRTGGEVTYGYGVQSFDGRLWQIDVTGLSTGSTPPEIVGVGSQASATVTAVQPMGDVVRLTLTDLVGGSFRPGEPLGRVGPNHPAFAQIATVSDRREWPIATAIEHGGLLPGTDVTLRRMPNGMTWALFFNLDVPRAPFFVPDHGDFLVALGNRVKSHSDWPGWDLTE